MVRHERLGKKKKNQQSKGDIARFFFSRRTKSVVRNEDFRADQRSLPIQNGYIAHQETRYHFCSMHWMHVSSYRITQFPSTVSLTIELTIEYEKEQPRVSLGRRSNWKTLVNAAYELEVILE